MKHFGRTLDDKPLRPAHTDRQLAEAGRPDDHHQRVSQNGRVRCHLGSADGISAVAPDDSLADHLRIADEPGDIFGRGPLVVEDGDDPDASDEELE